MSDGPNDGWETVTDPKEAAAAVRAGADKGPVTLTGEPLLSTLDPATASQVKAMSEGRMALPNGMSMRSPQAQKLLELTAQYDPTFDVANAPARIGARKAFMYGKQGQNIVSIATALEHSANLDDAITKLGNVQSPIPGTTHLVNGVRNAFRNADGNTNVTQFDNTVTPLIDELERAYTQTGGSVTAIKELRQGINLAQSLPQQRTAVQTFAKLLAGKLDEQNKSYNLAMGTVNQTVPGMTDQARQLLDAYTNPDYVNKGLAGVLGVGTQNTSPPAPPDGGSTPPTPNNPPPPPGSAPIAPTAAIVSQDGSSNFSTPDDQKIAGEAQAMLNDPKSTRADFDALASKYGRPAFGDDLDRALALRAKGGSASALTPVSGRDEGSPTYNGVVNGVLSQTGLDPADVRAAGIAAGDTVSFGTLPKVVAGTQALGSRLTGDNRALGDIYSSDLAAANATVAGARDAHPLAALAGDTAGFIGGDGILSAVPGVARLARAVPAALRPAVGDTLFGAATGLGSSDSLDEVPGNIAKGALLTGAGGAIGRGAARTVGGLLSPIASPAVQRLTKAGITLTPGQILGAGKGVAGKIVKGIEDKLTGFSGVGDVINATRRGSVEDLNIAGLNAQLGHSGLSIPAGVSAGHEANGVATDLANKAYSDALAPLSLQTDTQLGTDLSATASKVAGMGKSQQREFGAALSEHVDPYLPQNGAPLTGENLQNIKQGLDTEIATYRKSTAPNDQKLADRLSEVRDSYLSLADRGAPADAEAYRNARATYGGVKRLVEAAANTKEGILTPDQYRRAITKAGYGVSKTMAGAGRAPGQQLATDAATILPSSIADSGTAGRAQIGLLAARLGGGGILGGAEGYRKGGTAGALAGAAIGSALLSRPGARAAQYVLAGSRGRTANTLGALIRRNADLAGAVGSPLLLSRLSNGGN